MPDAQQRPQMRLGWVQGPPDARTLRLAAYTTPDLPTPPDSVDYMTKVKTWPVLGNDRYGDCVLVTTGHMMMAWSVYAGAATPFVPTTQQILSAYGAVTGFNPRTGAGDNGTVSLDALRYWKNTGIAGRRIAAFVKLDHRNLLELKTAAHLFSGVFLAAQLPLAADAQFSRRQPWTPVSGSSGRRGSWGGHAFRLGAYDPDGFDIPTWGRRQRVTYPWWAAYGAEAWGVLSPDQLNGEGLSDEGLDLARLRDDLANIPKL